MNAKILQLRYDLRLCGRYRCAFRSEVLAKPQKLQKQKARTFFASQKAVEVEAAVAAVVVAGEEGRCRRKFLFDRPGPSHPARWAGGCLVACVNEATRHCLHPSFACP